MENCADEQYKSIEKALKKVGFKVDKIMKQGNKTIITIIQAEKGKKNPNLPGNHSK